MNWPRSATAEAEGAITAIGHANDMQWFMLHASRKRHSLRQLKILSLTRCICLFITKKAVKIYKRQRDDRTVFQSNGDLPRTAYTGSVIMWFVCWLEKKIKSAHACPRRRVWLQTGSVIPWMTEKDLPSLQLHWDCATSATDWVAGWNFTLFSCDLDLNPMTLKYKLNPKILKIYSLVSRHIRNELFTWKFSEVKSITKRHTDTETDVTECTTNVVIKDCQKPHHNYRLVYINRIHRKATKMTGNHYTILVTQILKCCSTSNSVKFSPHLGWLSLSIHTDYYFITKG